jgi:hypothetical protein
MRKLAVIGALSAGLLSLAGRAGAATVDTLVGGLLSNSDNACINIVTLLSAADCSYAGTRYPVYPWQGPIFAAAWYEKNSIVDDPTDPGGVQPDGQDFRPVVGDNKLSVPLSGTFTVDDNGTPANGADDKISGTFSFGAADHWASTGNGDQALERWDAWNHTMAPTTVSSATALPGGGFEYVIGVRGKPTPAPLTAAADANLVFATESAPTGLGDPAFWSRAGADLPVGQRVGIESSPGFGNVDDSGTNYQPNVGTTTTATLTNYECLDSDDDCTRSFIMIGTSLVPGSLTTSLPPGFTNLVLIVSTGADGRITTAEGYWVREYVIRNGPPIDNEPANPGQWTIPNSWTGGRFTFKGCNPAGPSGVDDDLAVDEGSSDVLLPILANDTLGCTEPNTIAIITAPTNGTATPASNGITYTPNVSGNDFYDGPDSLTYTVTDGATNVTTVTTVNLTVEVVAPTASNCTGASDRGAAATCTVLTAGNAGSGDLADHVVNPGGGTLGTCSAAGSVLTFTPTAGAGNGTGGCSFTITDADGDESNTAQFSVTITRNSSTSSGGGGPQLPSGGSSLGLLGLGVLLAAVPLAARRRRSAR